LNVGDGEVMAEGREDVLKDKSYKLGLRIVKLCQHLGEEKREFILSKQILRSGT
jgi:hypothetical protein